MGIPWEVPWEMPWEALEVPRKSAKQQRYSNTLLPPQLTGGRNTYQIINVKNNKKGCGKTPHPCVDSLHTHDGITKFLEYFTLQGLGHEVPPHLSSGTESNLQVSFTNLVCKEEVTDVQCPGPLAGALLPIGLKKDGTLVVLV